jgi:hypothetical protein
MIAKRTAKNIGATSANSTAAVPLRLRRNRRRMLDLEGVDGGIEETSGREEIAAKTYPKLIVELFRPIQTEWPAPLTGY